MKEQEGKIEAKRHRQHISKGILRPVMVYSLPSASGWTFPDSGFHLNVYQERSLGWEARIWYHRSDITWPFEFNFLGKRFPWQEKKGKRVSHISSIFFSFSQQDEKSQKERSPGWKVITLKKTQWPVVKTFTVSLIVECVLESVVLSLYRQECSGFNTRYNGSICGVMCYHRK